MSPLREIFLFFFFFSLGLFFPFLAFRIALFFSTINRILIPSFFFFFFPFHYHPSSRDDVTWISKRGSFEGTAFGSIVPQLIGNVQCIETKRKRKTNSLPGNLGFLCGKPVLPGHRVLNNLIFQSDFFFFLFLIKLNLYHRKNSFEKFEISFLQGEGGRKKNYLDPEVVTIPFMEPSTIMVLPEPWTTSPHGSSWDVAKNQNSRSIALAISIERA